MSLEFRTSLCQLEGCTNSPGQPQGRRTYASERFFAPGACPPKLSYLGTDVWKRSPGNEDWRAAAPFADHYRLDRGIRAPIYVDEINWWPLVFSAKCRQIVAQEPALVGPDRSHIQVCSATTAKDPDDDERFTSYAWISKDDAAARVHPWPAPALFNRWLKRDILDWGFADALLAVGPLRRYLIQGIRETVLDSVPPAENQEFVVVSHSLGSYLMFSALDLKSDPDGEEVQKWKERFEKILGQTSHAYFFANQIRLLELANLDRPGSMTLREHLQNWSEARARAHQPPPQVVAWSDPNDLLTWRVPNLDSGGAGGANAEQVGVVDRPARNARWRWFGLLENPETAHINYDKNKRVMRELFNGISRDSQKVKKRDRTQPS